MTNLNANWDRISGSPWKSVYLSELYWLAKDAHDLCLHVFESAPVPTTTGQSYLRVDHQLHQDIYRILNNAARIGAMVKERERNKRNQSAGQYTVQQNRVQWLQQILSGIELSETLNSKVRHSLEHFDEFLDETALKSSRGTITAPTVFPIDVTIGRPETINYILPERMAGASIYPLRIYSAENRTFVNCGRYINIGAIAEECSQIHGRIGQISPRLLEQSEGDGRASDMLVITENTYSYSND